MAKSISADTAADLMALSEISARLSSGARASASPRPRRRRARPRGHLSARPRPRRHAGGRDFYVPIDAVTQIKPGHVQLSPTRRPRPLPAPRRRAAPRPRRPRPPGDQRPRYRVVRVNDLYVAHGPAGYNVVALDTGGRAIIRRIVPARMRPRFKAASSPTGARSSTSPRIRRRFACGRAISPSASSARSSSRASSPSSASRRAPRSSRRSTRSTPPTRSRSSPPSSRRSSSAR